MNAIQQQIRERIEQNKERKFRTYADGFEQQVDKLEQLAIKPKKERVYKVVSRKSQYTREQRQLKDKIRQAKKEFNKYWAINRTAKTIKWLNRIKELEAMFERTRTQAKETASEVKS